MMDHQGELGRLEGIIERLLASFDALKKEKKLLEEIVQKKEVEVHQLRQDISALNEEKQHICKRVDNLLATIEKWEEENVMPDDETNASEIEKSATQLEESPNKLFSLTG